MFQRIQRTPRAIPHRVSHFMPTNILIGGFSDTRSHWECLLDHGALMWLELTLWQRAGFVQAFDQGIGFVEIDAGSPRKAGRQLVHPLDPRKIPQPILDRMEKIRGRIEGELGKKPNDPGYCDAFVPRFYDAGRALYREGGLGFDYPYSYNLYLL